jgi:APA family basic amino acid/polyamine antiporter
MGDRPQTSMSASPKLGFASGIGLVVANMVGAGVFLSAGFMAQDLGPGSILIAWVVGMALALCGALSYATLAELVPRSGGEYRYLSELMHPALGYLAGYGSMLLGFSGPVAIDAIAAAAFLKTIVPGVHIKSFAILIIVGITSLHAVNLRVSKAGQNALVALKTLIVLLFVAVGLAFGSYDAPSWQPPSNPDGFAWSPFMAGLFYIAFAFSGWNASVYAAEEFEDPKRDVARATLVGCFGVGLLYLVINWIFVANLTPESAAAVFRYEEKRITLAHVLATDLLGESAGSAVSLMMVVAFVAAASAMAFVGPRVYAAMAEDGFLPRILSAKEGRVPVGSVVLQGAIAIVIVLVQPFQNIMHDVAAILTLFTLLTVLSLFRVRFARDDLPPPSVPRLVAAATYALLASWMLYFGFQAKTQLLLWVGIVVVVALAAYAATELSKRRTENRAPPGA